jgi:hypothetical protein
MQHKPVITADALSPDWMGAAARPLPDRVQPSGPLAGGRDAHDAPSDAPARSVWRSTLRWMRDAAIGLAIITTIPLVYIGSRGEMLQLPQSDLGARIAQVEPLRALRLPTTSELTPLAAGQLWHAIEVVEDGEAFPTHPAAPPAERSWRSASVTDDMFVGMGRREYNLPRSSDVLRAAANGLSEAERSYLRTVAEAPIWRDIDRIATAAAVDVVGARFVLPFRDDASPVLMPIPPFSATREIAYAGLARAAHHLAQGEPDRAEYALRSVLSYGFVMLDNAASAVEGVFGRVVVGIASDGLHTLYTMNGNAAGAALTEPFPEASATARRNREPMSEERLIEIAGDPTASRALRLESLRNLEFRSCSNVRGAVFGPSAASNAAFDNARRTLARYPSEVALVDLMQDVLHRPFGGDGIAPPGERMLLGAASIASTVLNRPHIQTCTRVLNSLH